MAVWRLRKNGKRLDSAAIEELGPETGELAFRQRLYGTSIMLAQLTHPDASYVIPCLDQAKLVRIDAHGLLIAGLEVIPRSRGSKSRSDLWPQAWWCEPRLNST